MQIFQSRPNGKPFTRDEDLTPDQDRVSAFRQRQREDLKRFEHRPFTLRQGQLSEGRYRDTDQHDEPLDYELPDFGDSDERGKGWRDSEGDKLHDFGVDEDVEFFDRDDVPLAELQRRRRAKVETQNDPLS